MERNEKDIMVKKSFKYKDEYNEYTLQLKRNNWWWILLLLPLLLLVRCTHDITVTCVDDFDDMPVVGLPVMLDYTSHIPLKDGHILCHTDYHLEQVTDMEGNAVFRDMETSVFAYVFYCLSKALINVDGGECMELKGGTDTCVFHYTCHRRLTISYRLKDVPMHVKDLEVNAPIANASLRYVFTRGTRIISDTTRSNAAGTFTLPQIPVCGTVDTVFATCEGYYDTLVVNRHVMDIITNTDSATVLMRPLKESFTFFVKDKESHEPIPGARATIKLTYGATVTSPPIATNVDGRGRGTYKNAPVAAKLAIHASATHYKDGDLEGNPTIAEFIALPDSERVVWLEPLPWTEQFRDVDSITGKAVAGATNYVRVTEGTGAMHADTQVSNSNGFFRVEAKIGNKIEITAECRPDYLTEDTVIPSFSKAELVRLPPNYVSLDFRTIDAETGDLLPGCTLRISATRSGAHKPDNSGTGEFTVKNLLESDLLTIVSSRKGYITNDTTINRKAVLSLLHSSNPHDFDIPMTPYVAPCDAGDHGEHGVPAGNVSFPQSYNMGTDHGTFDISYDTGTKCSDCIDIYNHNPHEDFNKGQLIWSSGQVATKGVMKSSISFAHGSVITIIVTTGPESGSFWKYEISCPY